MSVNKTELSFKPDVSLYISENLTTFNQRLAWKRRELKRARLIHRRSLEFKRCCENQVHYE